MAVRSGVAENTTSGMRDDAIVSMLCVMPYKIVRCTAIRTVSVVYDSRLFHRRQALPGDSVRQSALHEPTTSRVTIIDTCVNIHTFRYERLTTWPSIVYRLFCVVVNRVAMRVKYSTTKYEQSHRDPPSIQSSSLGACSAFYISSVIFRGRIHHLA